MAAWRRILCAVDLSSLSDDALDAAADWARRLGAELTILYVQETPAWVAAGLIASGSDRRELVAELEGALGAAARALEDRGGCKVHAVVRQGDVAEEVVSVAREGAFDLVVLASHGRKGLSRVALGSVAEQVVRNSPAPVMVVKRRVEAHPPPPSPP